MIDLLDVWVAKTPRRVFVGAGIQQVGEGRSSLDTCEGRQTPGVHQVGAMSVLRCKGVASREMEGSRAGVPREEG